MFALLLKGDKDIGRPFRSRIQWTVLIPHPQTGRQGDYCTAGAVGNIEVRLAPI
jgi:hypothetical protein